MPGSPPTTAPPQASSATRSSDVMTQRVSQAPHRPHRRCLSLSARSTPVTSGYTSLQCRLLSVAHCPRRRRQWPQAQRAPVAVRSVCATSLSKFRCLLEYRQSRCTCLSAPSFCIENSFSHVGGTCVYTLWRCLWLSLWCHFMTSIAAELVALVTMADVTEEALANSNASGVHCGACFKCQAQICAVVPAGASEHRSCQL